MKNLFYLLLALFVISSCDNTVEPDPPISLADSITMGAAYADEVFYSLENGIVKTSPAPAGILRFPQIP